MLLDLEKGPQWYPLKRAQLPNVKLDGVSDFKNKLESPSTDNYVVTRTQLQEQVAERKAKRNALETELKRQIESYQPFNDPKVRGDPSSTLFVCRMAYNATEDQIREEFSKYGHIASVRALKGYAFIVYDSPQSVSAAIEQTTGTNLWLGHRVLLDFERARRQPFWKPRRLGGGLGGRFSLVRQRRETARTHQIMRKGAASIAPQNNRQHNPRYNPSRGSNNSGARNGYRDDLRRPGSFDRRQDSRTADPRSGDSRNVDHRSTDRTGDHRSVDSRTADSRTARPDPRAHQGSGGRMLRQY